MFRAKTQELKGIIIVYIRVYCKYLYYQPHVGEGFLIGLSSRTRAADTILFNFRFLAAAFSSSIVLPSFRITLILEFGWVRVP